MLNYDDELDQQEFDEAVRERHYQAGVYYQERSESDPLARVSTWQLLNLHTQLLERQALQRAWQKRLEEKEHDDEPGISNL